MDKNSIKQTAYILDTSALMSAPELIAGIRTPAIIPAAVLKDLDRLKSSNDRKTAKNAKRASYIFERRQKTKGDITISYEDYNPNTSEDPVFSLAAAVKRQKSYDPVVVAADEEKLAEAERRGITAIPPGEAMIKVEKWKEVIRVTVGLIIFIPFSIFLLSGTFAEITRRAMEELTTWYGAFLYCIFAQLYILGMFFLIKFAIDQIRGLFSTKWVKYSSIQPEEEGRRRFNDDDYVNGRVLGLPGYAFRDDSRDSWSSTRSYDNWSGSISSSSLSSF